MVPQEVLLKVVSFCDDDTFPPAISIRDSTIDFVLDVSLLLRLIFHLYVSLYEFDEHLLLLG